MVSLAIYKKLMVVYSIPILTIIIVGYITKRVPAVAAKVAMLSGVILYCFSQFYLKGEVEAAGGTYPHYLHVIGNSIFLQCIVNVSNWLF